MFVWQPRRYHATLVEQPPRGGAPPPTPLPPPPPADGKVTKRVFADCVIDHLEKAVTRAEKEVIKTEYLWKLRLEEWRKRSRGLASEAVSDLTPIGASKKKVRR